MCSTKGPGVLSLSISLRKFGAGGGGGGGVASAAPLAHPTQLHLNLDRHPLAPMVPTPLSGGVSNPPNNQSRS